MTLNSQTNDTDEYIMPVFWIEEVIINYQIFL